MNGLLFVTLTVRIAVLAACPISPSFSLYTLILLVLKRGRFGMIYTFFDMKINGGKKSLSE